MKAATCNTNMPVVTDLMSTIFVTMVGVVIGSKQQISQSTGQSTMYTMSAISHNLSYSQSTAQSPTSKTNIASILTNGQLYSKRITTPGIVSDSSDTWTRVRTRNAFNGGAKHEWTKFSTTVEASDFVREWATVTTSESAASDFTKKQTIVATSDSAAYDSTKKQTDVATSDSTSNSTTKQTTFTTSDSTATDSTKKQINVATSDSTASNSTKKQIHVATSDSTASNSTKKQATFNTSDSIVSDSTKKQTTFNTSDSIASDSTKKQATFNTSDSIASDSTKRQTTFDTSDSIASDSTKKQATFDTSDSTASNSTKKQTTFDTSDSTKKQTTFDTSDSTTSNSTSKQTTFDTSHSTKKQTTFDTSDSTKKQTTADASDYTREWITVTTCATDSPEHVGNVSHQSTTPKVLLTFTEQEPVNQSYNGTADNSTTNSPIIIPVISFAVGSIVMMLNILVMVASAKNHELRQNTNYNLVMGLSLSDFLLGFSMFLVGIRLQFPMLIRNLGLCIATNLSSITSLSTSYLQAFLISFHRFIVISDFDRAQRFFDKGKYYLYIIEWTVVIALFASFISPDLSHSTCFSATVFGKNTHVARQTLFTFVSTLLLLTLIFYSLAIYQLSRRSMNVSNVTEAGQLLNRKRKRLIRSMKLVTMILAALFVFSGPLVIVLGLVYDKVTQPVVTATIVAANFNSFLNPIIYCSHITQLRNELKSMFTCK
jgi:hypothetical protein